MKEPELTSTKLVVTFDRRCGHSGTYTAWTPELSKVDREEIGRIAKTDCPECVKGAPGQ